MAMAYTTRTKDPKLEERMQSAIRKRARQLVGLLLIALAFVLGYALSTYSPNDPSLLGAEDTPPLSLAVISATISSMLIPTIGLAAWAIPASLIVWGARLLLSVGEERLFSRAIIIPIFIAFVAIFFATKAPWGFWTFSWGMGGISGDAVFEIILENSPIDLTASVRLFSLGLGVVAVLTGIYALGFNIAELRAIFTRGLVGTWAFLLVSLKFLRSLFRMGTKGAKKGGEQVAVARRQMRDRKHLKDGMPIIRTEKHMAEDAKNPKKLGRSTVFPAMPVFGKKRKVAAEEEAGDGRGKKYAAPDLSVRNPALDPHDFPTLKGDVSQDQDRVSSRIKEVIAQKLAAGEATNPEEISTPEVEETEEAIEAPEAEVEEKKSGNIFSRKLKEAVNIFADVSEDADEPILPMEEPEPTLPSAPDPAKSVVAHETPAKPKPSKKAQAEAQPNLFADATSDAYEPPELNFLTSPTVVQRHHQSDEALEENARMLENVLDDYGVKGEIVSVRPGPVVTMYELEPAPGLKASRVIGLADDIARSMSALSARVSTVPGRSVIGIELPNENRETVLLREIISTHSFGDGKHALPLALGKDISGKPEIADLSRMPHLLIAGTTGSGKSVAINTMIMSLLYKLTPDDCRLIMIDPKMLELSVYDNIPHLLSPVVTVPKKAVVALKWVVAEMEERYRKMSKMGVRNIGGYNSRVADAIKKGENFERTVQTGLDENTGEPVFETESFAPEKLPFIVVIVDEMADLMMVAGKEIEACIQRLAQMARASGIHLIMATQRPSVDVITGTIKANFPTRISFQVTSKVDSRTILGEMGAEQLLGMGDMLYMEGGGKITRIHAPFVSDEEVEIVVNHLKTFGPPSYVGGVVKGPEDEEAGAIDEVLGLGGNTNSENALYDQAVQIVAQDRKCSTSYIQRKLSIGYNKAAKIVEEMEENGIVSAANHVGKREILLPEQ